MGREAAKLMPELISEPGKVLVGQLFPCLELKSHRTTKASQFPEEL